MVQKEAAPKEAITLVTPVYNDWASFRKLVQEIDACLDGDRFAVTVLAVDDGSSEPWPDPVEPFGTTPTIVRVEILQLSRNLGHQRAIAIGLSHAVEKIASDRVVVMDADGEDRPETLPELIRESQATERIVFARRSRRRESPPFLAGYVLYRILFQILTGKPITFGNYCAMPSALAGRVVLLPDLWNHFAAGIMRSKLPQETLKVPRGKRYFGASKMRLVDLVLHGLSAISVYTDVLAVRLILFTSAIIVSSMLGGVLLLYVRYFTPLAIPGWATTVAFGLAIILFQAFMFLSLISFMILASRSVPTVIPVKHYRDFVLGSRVIHGAA